MKKLTVVTQFVEGASELAIDWRALYVKKYISMCCSPNIIRKLKSRTIAWT
jgi:hypothetical protein